MFCFFVELAASTPALELHHGQSAVVAMPETSSLKTRTGSCPSFRYIDVSGVSGYPKKQAVGQRNNILKDVEKCSENNVRVMFGRLWKLPYASINYLWKSSGVLHSQSSMQGKHKAS